MYDVILFDLDGTITESAPGICNSVAHSLTYFGIQVEDPSTLKAFVGPPLMESFQVFYGFNEDQAKKAVEYYREYYRSGGMFENSVYDGVEELLQTLKKAGKKIVLATSKPEKFAVQILEHFGLAKYFDVMAGASMDEKRTDKAEVITYALGLAGVREKSRVIMVGDREHDVIGAKKNGLECIGVLYGYGDRDELEKAGAEYIVEQPVEIEEIVLKER